MDAVDENVDMVFLCQPNNPTGQLAEPALVQKLLRRCEAVGALLAVDECFLDFLPDADDGRRSSAEKLGTCHFESVHQALRHGGRAAGLLPLRDDRRCWRKCGQRASRGRFSSLAQAAGIAALEENRLCGARCAP